MKNFKNLLVVFSLVLLVMSCDTTPKSYVVTGTVADSLGAKMAYMFELGSRTPIDSAVVENGKFVFEGKADTAVVRQIMVNRLGTAIILENGKIAVDMAPDGKTTGTLLNDSFTELLGKAKEQNKEYSEFMKGFDRKAENKDSIAKVYDDFMKGFSEKSRNMYNEAFEANKDNAIGAYALYNLLRGSSDEEIEAYYNEAGANVQNYAFLQKKMGQIENAKKTAEGMPFIDFTIENGNIDGTKASFSDYIGKGKYVLVDFWASWCGPCKAEIPNLQDVYKKHKGDKFEILGVAVWNKREDTMKSLEEYDMPWKHIIDAQNIPTDIYAISGIPHIILFGPDGTIVARGLRGEKLQEKVAEVLK